MISTHKKVFIGLLLYLFWFSFITCTSRQSSPPATTEKIQFHKSEGLHGAFNFLGYHNGAKVPDFTIYGQNGARFNLYHELRKGKPLMLINGSYTCDITRKNIDAINRVTRTYADQLDIYVIQTLEAHPSDTVSPYSVDDEVWVGPNNESSGIYRGQPKTYGERVELSKEWKQDYQIEAPILVDNPDNSYWLNFGQAPNMVYVIEPDCVVHYHQTWFNEEGIHEHVTEIVGDE